MGAVQSMTGQLVMAQTVPNPVNQQMQSQQVVYQQVPQGVVQGQPQVFYQQPHQELQQMLYQQQPMQPHVMYQPVPAQQAPVDYGQPGDQPAPYNPAADAPPSYGNAPPLYEEGG